MRIVSLACLVLLTTPLHTTCKKKKSATASEVKHQTGALTRGDAAIFWHTRTPTDEMSNNPERYLPLNHPATERVRYWTETLDGLAREQFSPALDAVPKPLAFVVRNREANAYVQNETVCFSIPLKRAGADEKNPVPQEQSIQLNNGNMSLVSRPENCSATPTSTERTALIRAFNSSGSKCSLVEKNQQLEASDACFTSSPALRNYTSSATITFNATKAAVFVQAGMMLQANELELATVIAHELGHYYRAHSTSLLPPVSYFFRHHQYTPQGTPTPAPELEDLSDRWRQSFRMSLYKAPQRRTDVHPGLMRKYRQWVQFLRDHCAEKTCVASCKNAYQMSLDFPDTYGAVVQGEVMDATENKFYQDFSAQILTCGTELPVTNYIFTQPSFILGIETTTLPDDTGGAKNFTEQLLHGSRIATAVENDVLDLQAQVEKEQLGWYTEEQEADDILLEIVQLAGIPFDNAISYRVKALTQWSKESKIPVVGQFEAAACMKAYERGWKNELGEPLVVPVGMWEDQHHSACYRLYNVTEEIRRHTYMQKPLRVTPLSDEKYRAIQDLLLNDINGPAVVDDAPQLRWY